MTMRRGLRAVIAIVTATAAVVAAFGIAPSLAAWTHTEYDNGPVAPLNCGAPGVFSTTSWGQEVSGQVAGIPLDGKLAGVLGVTTTSGSPHSTAAGGAGSAGLTYLTNDAWANNLQVGALNAIDLGGGVTLPIGQNLGVETQYARATTTGIATGASGAVTTSGAGLVSLQTPTSATPGVGSLSLATALSGTIGHDLSSDITQLANASLTVGALGSTASVDSCNAAWQGVSTAAALVRNYVIAKLGLSFNSSLIGTASSVAAGSVNTLTKSSEVTLATTLNAHQPLGPITGTALTSITSALASALPGTEGGRVVSLGSPTTVQVGVTFDPSPALSVLNSTITAGPVSINLATGEIDADLAALDPLGLNGRSPNTPILTAAMLTAINADVATAISSFVTGTLAPALTATLNSASVVVNIASQVGLNLPLLGTVNIASLDIGITGSLGKFLSPGTYGNPTVSVVLTSEATGAITTALGLLGLNITTILAAVTSTLNTTVLSGVVPAIDTAVLSPLLTTATGDVVTATTALTTALAPVVTALGSVVGVIGNAVQLTVNAQPDQPASVGSPETPVAGRYFESALQVGVLNTANGSSTIGLYLGSSSVGPNFEN